ncbi:hypothetical protein LEP1GSC047_1906 [Leptospira inadai serovar Lyme str. 10]|uniref:Uncharacterized protein n=2 Tax=Leptospira inadai serovar Lyme TaxID=293084 RepID=V6H8H3_9LEPT|nr:hypothetical protein LEP1GSC047_1906 [Leptospira inadai serovar Lyme str. 10]
MSTDAIKIQNKTKRRILKKSHRARRSFSLTTVTSPLKSFWTRVSRSKATSQDYL